MSHIVFGSSAHQDYGVLVKYNTDGVKQWDAIWGGDDDFGNDIALDESGDAYIVGTTLNQGEGTYIVFLAKYASNGTQLWNRTWGGANLNDFRFK
jgi:hypothetical protein